MILTHMKTDRVIVAVVTLIKNDVEVGLVAGTYAISATVILPRLLTSLSSIDKGRRQ